MVDEIELDELSFEDDESDIDDESFYEEDDFDTDEFDSSELLIGESTRESELSPEGRSRRKAIGTILKIAGATAVLGGFGAIIDKSGNNGIHRRKLFDKLGLAKFSLTADSAELTYKQSPWEVYARLEDKILDELGIPEKDFPRLGEYAIRTGDYIADSLAKKLLLTEDTYNIADIINGIQRDTYMTLLAKAIEETGIIYHEESLLSKAFNKKLHSDRLFGHLDCDLLAYLMCHIGRRHGVDMQVVNGPKHAYLFVPTGDGKGYVIEPTEFRKIKQQRTRNAVYTNYAGTGIGDAFFSTFERQRVHGGLRTDDEFEKSAKLHTIIKDEQRIEDSILANILAGIGEYADSIKDIDLRVKIFNLYVDPIKRGSDSYLLNSNFYVSGLKLARDLMDQNRLDAAENVSEWTVWMRDNHGELLIDMEPIERVISGRIQMLKGNNKEAEKLIFEALKTYDSLLEQKRDKTRAINIDHANALTYGAQLLLDKGNRNSRQILNQMIIPAFNQYNQYKNKEDFEEFKWLRRKKIELDF